MQDITAAAVEAADVFGGQIQDKDIRTMLENAQPSILAEEFAPLRARMAQAAREIKESADGTDDSTGPGINRAFRLRAKAEGVRLAMSYLDEIIRSL